MSHLLQRALAKLPLITTLLAISSSALAGGGWTGWAVPVRVDVVRNEGVMVYGSFGNPGGCTVADQFFVAIGHPQYNQIYATLMTALTAGRQVMAYVDSCSPETWYTVSSVTFNFVDVSSALNIQ
jgi:hypothetical protein